MKLTDRQQRHLDALRAQKKALDDGVRIHPTNIAIMFGEALNLIDSILEEEFYFLRDGSEASEPGWWIYSPKMDAWHCLYGDSVDPDDPARMIQSVLDGEEGWRGIFQGLDEGAAAIFERFGVGPARVEREIESPTLDLAGTIKVANVEMSPAGVRYLGKPGYPDFMIPSDGSAPHFIEKDN